MPVPASTVDLTTVTYIKRALTLVGAASDDLVQDLLTAASQELNARYDRELTPRTDAAERTFRARAQEPGRARFLDLTGYDLRTLDTLTLDPGGSAERVLVEDEHFELLPTGGHRLTDTFLIVRFADDLSLDSTGARRFGSTRVAVTGDWGAWATAGVPEVVQRACAVTVASWVDRAVNEYGMDEDPRQSLPSRSRTWAIPDAAHTLLVGAGVPRMTI